MSSEKVEDKTKVNTQVAAPPDTIPPRDASRFKTEWREFRKRYLTIQRIIFWTIWIGAHTGLFVYGWIRQGRDIRLVATNKIGYSVSMSRGAGLCIAFDSALILLPMLRTVITMIYPKFTFLNLDENIWFHRQVAYALLFFTVIHVTGFYVNFYKIEELKIRPEDAYTMLYRSWAGVTGWIMCLVMFLIYTTASKSIRIMNFETFRYTHFLYWVFFIALLLHAAGCFVHTKRIASINPAFANIEDEGRKQCLGYNSWRYVIVGVILYGTSLLYGSYRALRKTTVIAIKAHPERVVEIQFVKPSFKYHAGQWLWINVPAVSRLQWHPFTITSAPSDEHISIHIRCVGDWSDEIANYFGITQEIEDMTEICTAMPIPEGFKVMVDGPFGAPAELVYREHAVICVGSGIGITPWASVLKDIRTRVLFHDPTLAMKRVDLIWVCRNINQLAWFANLLVSIREDLNKFDPKMFRCELYLTRVENKNSVPAKLRDCTKFGRPKWDVLLKTARDEMESGGYADGVHKIGVFLCGSHPLGKELAKKCRLYSDRKYTFKFKKEHF